MRPRLAFVAATAASLALVLTGCGDDASNSAQKQDASSSQAPSGSAPGSSGPSGGPQASKAGAQWMDGFCGSMGKFTKASQNVPKPESQDPAAVKRAMSQMLGNISQGAKTLVSDLDSMTPSPIKGGDKFVSTAKDSYGTLRKTAVKAKSTVDQAPASDEQATKKAVQSAQSDLKNVDLQKPLKQLQSNQQLATAFQQAPTCQQLMRSAQQQQQQQQPQQPPQGGGQAPAPAPGN